jgi:hypothetical protein
MWGGLKGGGMYGMKVLGMGGTWTMLEEVGSRVKGVDRVREVFAGMGAGAIFSLIGLFSLTSIERKMTRVNRTTASDDCWKGCCAGRREWNCVERRSLVDG